MSINPSEWIGRLSSANDVERRDFAALCYLEGKKLGEAAIAAWRKIPEFERELSGPPTVGVAVTPERFAAIRAVMDSPPLADVPADQDAAEFELHLQTRVGEAWLDILTTRAPGSGGAIDKFLSRFGEGIQQVEFPVTSVDRATAALKSKEVTPIYPQTRAGANGTRVNFFLAATPDGKKVLVELVESAS